MNRPCSLLVYIRSLCTAGNGQGDGKKMKAKALRHARLLFALGTTMTVVALVLIVGSVNNPTAWAETTPLHTAFVIGMFLLFTFPFCYLFYWLLDYNAPKEK